MFYLFPVTAFTAAALTTEQKEATIRNFLIIAAGTNLGQLNYLLQTLLKLVNGNHVSAR